jgi:hypothetical protein
LDYIREQETERLFIAWPLIKSTKESLTLDLKAILAKTKIEANEDYDYIYSLVTGNRVMNDMPPANTNAISKPTENIALNYSGAINRDTKNTKNELKEELFELWLVDEKLTRAFQSLPPLKQNILKLFYWEMKTWDEVLEELKLGKQFYGKHQARKHKKDAIRQLSITLRISIETYENVMKIVGREM